MPGPGLSDAHAEDLVGQTLDGRWTVESRLGAGGMGSVWRAREPDGSLVAVKVLRADMLHTEELFKRFAQEADAVSRIDDEHIVKLLGYGHTRSGAPFYAMEFCEGPDLLAVSRSCSGT